MANENETLHTAVKRVIQGPRIDLKNLPGFWFRPCKYPVKGKDELEVLSLKASQAAGASALSGDLLDKVKAVAADSRDSGQVDPEAVKRSFLESLSAEDIGAIMQRQDPESIRVKPRWDLVMQYGIGENNFAGAERYGASSETIEALMLDASTTCEIVAAIEGWNRPLASEKQSYSGTSSSGSTPEQNSLKEEESSPTEQTQD